MMLKGCPVAGIVRTAALCTLLLTGSTGTAVGPGDVEDPMFTDPVLIAPVVRTRYHPRLKQLMTAALARPDVDTRRRAADTIGRLARAGMPGLDDLAEPLKILLNTSPSHPRLRLAAARALIRMDAHGAAEDLRVHAVRDGLDMIHLVDPALASWNDPSAIEMWMAMLKNPAASRAARISAIESLAAVRHQDAALDLQRIALDPTRDPALRLAAGGALGRLVPAGLDAAAESLLAAGRGLPDRAVAAAIIAEHKGKEAVVLMRRMAVDREPAVACVALRRLVDLDPMQVRDLVEPLRVPGDLADYRKDNLSNMRLLADDPKIRKLAAEVLVFEATPQTVNLLAPMMDDPHPDVRVYVRRSLVEMDRDQKLKATIRHVGVAALNADEVDNWRIVEQAALLLGAIDHEPVAPRMVDLLVAARPEVRNGAAVGLRRLAIADTLPQVLAVAQLICKGLEDIYAIKDPRSIEQNMQSDSRVRDAINTVDKADLDRQVGHMMQMFGQMRYRPAEPLMRRHIPKHSFAVMARGAAIWALGHLHAGSPDSELAELFAGRLSDLNPNDPEFQLVRRCSAISMGRMKAAQVSDTLAAFLESENHVVDIGGACRWALIQIDGEDRPPLRPTDHHPRGNFLDPADTLPREDYLIAEP